MCVGVFEMDAFAKGTYGVAATLAELTGKGCITIIGGGGMLPYYMLSHCAILYQVFVYIRYYSVLYSFINS